MKPLLTLMSLAVIATTTTSGCFINHGDDDGEFVGGVPNSFGISWNLTSGVNDQNNGCPPDGLTMQAKAFPVGGSCPNPGFDGCFVECYQCTDGGATFGPIAGGDYDVFLRLTDEGGETPCDQVGNRDIIAQSSLATVSVGFDDSVAFDFPVDGGFLENDYTIEDTRGALYSCAQAQERTGARLVSFVSTLASNMAIAEQSEQACGDGVNAFAQSMKIPFGVYAVSRDLVNNDLASVLVAPDNVDNVAVDYGNEIVVLEPARFILDL